MSSDAQELISRLKFLSKVSRGEKINVPHLFVQNNSWQTTISRTLWNPDSRQSTQNFIRETILNSFERVELYLKTNNITKMKLANNIIQDIQDSVKGIQNIQYTYKNDAMFTCNLDTIIQLIEAKILELQTKHPDFECFQIHSTEEEEL